MRFHDPRVIAYLNATTLTGGYLVLFFLSALTLEPSLLARFTTYLVLVTGSGILYAGTYFFSQIYSR